MTDLFSSGGTAEGCGPTEMSGSVSKSPGLGKRRSSKTRPGVLKILPRWARFGSPQREVYVLRYSVEKLVSFVVDRDPVELNEKAAY
jgi:hypothetical protein